MGLRKAMEVVIKDLLQNSQGGIYAEDLENVDIDKLVNRLTNDDNFLVEFVGHNELMISDYFEIHGEELGL